MGETTIKKHKPSRNMLKEKGLTVEELIDAYEKYKTINKASKSLGVNAGTFHRTMKNNGYVFTRGRKTFKKKHTSVVAEWLRKYNDVALPRNYKDIAEIMDIPVSTVRAYFKRRQERLHQILKEYNNIIGLELFGLKDIAGRMVTNKGLSTIKVYVDDFALCYKAMATTLSGNRLTFIIQLQDYLKMFDVETEDKK